MCLEVKKPGIIVAKEDMVCYKVMIEYFGNKGVWVSPYQGMTYKEGQSYELKAQLQLLDSSKTVKEYPYRVEEGFHSFTSLSEALFFLNAFEARHPCLNRCSDASRYVIVKCIIPKGTTYAEGLFFDWGNKFHSYCSEKIVCEGKIENE